MPKGRYIAKFNLLKELNKVDKSIKYPEMILGTSSLSVPPMISPARGTMFVKHVTQHMTLNKPQFPRVFTGTENLYGDISSYYYKMKDECKVVKIIKKFDSPHVGVVFIKNMRTGEYDVIDRVDAKPFTEVFGFAFDNDAIDSLEENDILEPDQIIARSTGYDEYNNHMMGVNALTLFSFHPNLTEDAAMVSESFANRVSYNKVHQIEIKIPVQNMIPLNVHGDNETYKIFPDVGEMSDGVLAALRTISITQMSDLSNDQLRVVNHLQDIVYSIKGEIIDISLYTNTPVPDGMVYDQIRYYLEKQRVYYKQIYEFCQSIKKEKRTLKLKTLYQLSMDHCNDNAKWVDKNVIKSIVIHVTVRERVKLVPGQKLTG